MKRQLEEDKIVTNHGRAAPAKAGEENTKTEDIRADERRRARSALKPNRRVIGTKWK